VPVKRALEIYKEERRVETPPDRVALRKRARVNIWVGFALALPVFLIFAAISASLPALGDLAAVLGGILRIVGIISMGFGMADLAESKGHSRNNGWWVLLFLIGLLIVVLLPDRYRYVDASEVNPYWPLPLKWFGKNELKVVAAPAPEAAGTAPSQPVGRAWTEPRTGRETAALGDDSAPWIDWNETEETGCMPGAATQPTQGTGLAGESDSSQARSPANGAVVSAQPKRRTPQEMSPTPREETTGPAASQTVTEQLAKLSELRTAGHLSEVEFAKAKALLLGLNSDSLSPG